MAILAIISTAFENAVWECFHFQRFAGVEHAGTSMCRGNANRSAFSLVLRISVDDATSVVRCQMNK